MLDLNCVKVLGAWSANLALGIATKIMAGPTTFASLSFLGQVDDLFKSLLTVSQFGVAVVTIVYIVFKIRNERRK